MNLPVKKVENHTYNLKYGTADSTSRRNSGDAYDYQAQLLATPKTSIWSEQRDSSPVLSGFLLHSIRLVFIQGETLGLADPLLLLQLDIFLGLLERDIAGKI